MATVLYEYWRSSASYRVRIALNLGGISYDSVAVDLVNAEQITPNHLARSPQGLVPVLDIDGHRLTQSLAILDYLNETRGLGLLPQDPMQAARARALAQMLAVDVHPVCNVSVVDYVASLCPDHPSAKKDWMQRFIVPGLRAFETMLAEYSQTPFCCGSQPTLADVCLIPQLYNARRWGVDFSNLPRLSAAEAACLNNKAFAAAHPDQHHPKRLPLQD